MKPTKNKVFCKDCGRTKMLFETEKKAENFIKFNKEEIEAESGYGPQRSYSCLFCGGWHITSIKEKIGLSKKEQIFEQYQIDNAKITIKEISKDNNAEKQNQIMKELESQIKEMETSQQEKFISENIVMLNKEIELLCNSKSRIDQEKLRTLRQNLTTFYIIRKQNGFQQNSATSEELIEKKRKEQRDKELEEWKLWAEKRY